MGNQNLDETAINLNNRWRKMEKGPGSGTQKYANGLHHDNDGDHGKVEIFASPLILPRTADIFRESW